MPLLNIKFIKDTAKSFEKKYGKFSVSSLDDYEERGYVPTGVPVVDYVIGRPGFPIGRMTEIFGHSSSGKSALCAQTIAMCQKNDIIPVLIDTEHSYDPKWLKNMFGADPESILMLHPEYVEETFDLIRQIIPQIREEYPNNAMAFFIDSVSAQPTKAELDAEDSTDSKQRAMHATRISEGCRKVGGLAWNNYAALIFISQLKDNPGMMYGTNQHKLGGHALDFHCGLQLETRRLSFLKNDKQSAHGYKLSIKSKKNKFVEPDRERMYKYLFADGFNVNEQVLNFMSELDLITKSGGWFKYNNESYRAEDLLELIGSDIDTYKSQIYSELRIAENTDISQLRILPSNVEEEKDEN